MTTWALLVNQRQRNLGLIKHFDGSIVLREGEFKIGVDFWFKILLQLLLLLLTVFFLEFSSLF